MQEAFMRFHRAGNDAGDADARPLMFVIARNLLKDQWKITGRDRARRAPVSREGPDATLNTLASDGPGPDRGLMARQDLTTAAAVIRDLPPRCREAFLLHRFEHLTYRQIADRLGVSVSMVEKHLAEAMRRLKNARED